MFERRNYAVMTVTLLIYKRVAACGAVMAVCGVYLIILNLLDLSYPSKKLYFAMRFLS